MSYILKLKRIYNNKSTKGFVVSQLRRAVVSWILIKGTTLAAVNCLSALPLILENMSLPPSRFRSFFKHWDIYTTAPNESNSTCQIMINRK